MPSPARVRNSPNVQPTTQGRAVTLPVLQLPASPHQGLHDSLDAAAAAATPAHRQGPVSTAPRDGPAAEQQQQQQQQLSATITVIQHSAWSRSWRSLRQGMC